MTLYRFGRCQIDSASRELRMSGLELEVEPKVLDLILFLIERRPDVITRQELVDTVWKGRVVSDSAVSVAINSARKVIGDSGREQACIKTIHKHGYRFVAEVETVTRVSVTESVFTRNENGVSSASIPQKVEDSVPTIAIVPGVVAAQDNTGLAYAFIDDIATELSRFHLLKVLSTLTTFNDSVKRYDAKSMAELFGVDYLITVSFEVVKSHCLLKITVNDMNCVVLDSARHEVQIADLIRVREDIVSSLVCAVSSSITEQEIKKCSSLTGTKPSAYTCLLRGFSLYKLGEVSLERSREALSWFEQALKSDASCARAYAWRECCGADFQPDATDPAYLEQTRVNLERALELDPNDHEVHRVSGGLYCVCGDHELGDYHLAKAVELNPSDTRVLLRAGFYRSFLPQQKNDMVFVRRAFELNPRRPEYYYFDRAVVLVNKQQYAQALHDFEICKVDTLASSAYKTAALQAEGRFDEAATQINHVKQTYPEDVGERIQNRYPFICYGGSERGDRFHALLQDAGWPA